MTDSEKRASTWRRRWRRTAQERRATAAASLGDVFHARRWPSPLAAILLASLVVHGAIAPLLPGIHTGGPRQIAARQDSYLRKVVQKERAKHVAADVRRRITVPPPPPDPEQFVSETLTQELTQDLAQVTSGLLDVKLEKSLTDHVQATLEQELKEASRKIATGKVSKAEIKALQRQFRQKTMDAAREWREVHREEYQIEIAAKTVTEWYEERIASQIRDAVKSTLFGGRHNLWSHVFHDRYTAPGFVGLGRVGEFPRLRQTYVYLADGVFSPWPFRDKSDRPRALSECKDVGRGNMVRIPDWPGKPTPGRVEIFTRLVRLYGKDWEACFDEYVRDYYPHRAEAMAGRKKELLVLKGRLESQAEALMKAAESGAGPAKLKGPAEACTRALKGFTTAWEKVFVEDATRNLYAVINRAVRSRVLRGRFREVSYRRTIDELVEKLRPPVEQLAESQFREGMVLSEKGVHEAMKEFRVKAVALLKRDMEKIISRPFYHRRLFDSFYNPYEDEVTGRSGPPDEAQVRADEAALAKAAGKLPAEDRAYVEARAAGVEAEITSAVSSAIDRMLERILTEEGRLERRYYAHARTVDYADPFKERLEARDMAWKGRRQDLADLTEQGVPDTSTPLVALASGAGGGNVALKPLVAGMHPGYFDRGSAPAAALRWSAPVAPPSPGPWGPVTQPEVRAPFGTPNFEAIPFLVNFPKLDGDLSDWGRIRPLVLRRDNCEEPELKKEPILVYAAWNYQGFFFGYRVDQPRIKFSLPSQYRVGEDGVTLIKDSRISAHNKFVSRGDFLVLMFDTLDARLPFRGDPHAQEFYILPRGTATDPDLPGADRVFASRRDGMRDGNFGWGRRICNGRLFPPQPHAGPDGTSPYRVCRLTEDGYTVEVFLPRTIFKVPVFAPGWYVGFDCYVGTGKQPQGSGARYQGKGWANNTSWPCSVGNNPGKWGDLLMLGTDARVTIQDAATGWPRSTAVRPGHAHLVTVADPDRNVSLTSVDTVLVSAEVISPGAAGGAGDVELYVLKETGRNTSVFQGYVSTQPGTGSKVAGVLELLPGREVRFGYVDLADSKGRRNVVYQQTLPVISPALSVLHTAQ